MAKHENRDYDTGGLAFVGVFIAAAGIGAFYNHIEVALVIGFGVGLVVMALFAHKN